MISCMIGSFSAMFLQCITRSHIFKYIYNFAHKELKSYKTFFALANSPETNFLKSNNIMVAKAIKKYEKSKRKCKIPSKKDKKSFRFFVTTYLSKVGIKEMLYNSSEKKFIRIN